VEEDHFPAPLPHHRVQVHHPGDLLRQAGELPVVGGEEGLASYPFHQITRDGPRKRHSIVSARPTPKLIQDHQRPFRGPGDNGRRLPHLGHEGGQPPGEGIGGPDPGVDLVEDGKLRILSGHERPYLRQKRDQRHLSQEDRLPRHIRPGDDGQLRLFVHHEIVGNELTRPLHHRVPALPDGDAGRGGEPGALPAVALGRFGQRSKHIYLGQRLSQPPQPRKFRPYALDNFFVELELELRRLGLGLGEPVGEGLKLGRSEALHPFEALATPPLRWDLGEVGLCELEVVTQYLVIAHPEGGDSGAVSFPPLQVHDLLPQFRYLFPEEVQLRRVSLPHESPLLRGWGRRIHEKPLQLVRDPQRGFLHRGEATQKDPGPPGQGPQDPSDSGDGAEGASQEGKVQRGRPPHPHPPQEPWEITAFPQRRPELPQFPRSHEGFHRLQALLDDPPIAEGM